MGTHDLTTVVIGTRSIKGQSNYLSSTYNHDWAMITEKVVFLDYSL